MIVVSASGVMAPKGPNAAPSSSLTLPYRNCRLMEINNSKNQNNPMSFEVRKVQDSRGCLMISVPRRFTRWLKITKGTLVKVQFDSDDNDGNRLIIQKVNLGGME